MDRTLQVYISTDRSRYLIRINQGGRIHAHRTSIAATAPNLEAEPPEVRAQVYNALATFAQELADNPAPSRCKHKTIGDGLDAYLEWFALNRRDPRIVARSRYFRETFGAKRITALTDTAAREWAESLIPHFHAFDSFRLTVSVAQGFVSWLQKRGEWLTLNPFDGLTKEFSNRFPAIAPERSRITDEEYFALLEAAGGADKQAARIFLQTARLTGLRPAEIFGLDMAKLDRKNRTWTVPLAKARGRLRHRTIAIPDMLITFLTNENVTAGILPLSGLRKQFDLVVKGADLPDIKQKTFRRDFAGRMEDVGAAPDVINLHQGRQQSGVLFQNYLTDPGRAARLCRPYLDIMFAPEKRLTLIHS